MDSQTEDVAEVTRNTWATMFELETSPRDGAEPAIDLRAEIKISGAWTGRVVVGVPLELAESAASSMFACQADEISPEEIEDVIGELVNVVAGGVKATLEGENALGLPEVTRAKAMPASSEADRTVCFDCGDHRFVVRLAEDP